MIAVLLNIKRRKLSELIPYVCLFILFLFI